MVCSEANVLHERGGAMSKVTAARRAVLGVLAIVMIALVVVAPAGAAPAWLAPDDISAAAPGVAAPRLVLDFQGNAVAVWLHSEGTRRTVEAAVRPTGGDWQTPVEISNSDQIADDPPQVTVDPQGTVVVMWQRFQGGSRIVQSALRPAGGGWQTPVDISSTAAASPRLAVDAQGNAVAVWRGYDGTSSVVQSAVRPTDGNWQAPIDLSATGQSASNPQLAVDPHGNAVAVWKRSVDFNNSVVQSAVRPAGGDWQTPIDISTVGQYDHDPELAVDRQGNAVAVWWRLGSGGSHFVIQSAFRPVDGAWQVPVDVLSTGSRNDAFYLRLAIDPQGNAIAVWTHSGPTDNAVQSAVRPAGGDWQAPVEVSGTEVITDPVAGDLRLAVGAQGNAIVTWTYGTRTEMGVQSAVRQGGGDWQAPVYLSALGENASKAQVALDPQGNAIAVWGRSDGLTGGKVHAALRPARGDWQAPVEISAAGQSTLGAEVAFDPQGNALAIWQRVDGTNWNLQGAGYDAAGPVLRSLSVPASGVAGRPLSFSVSPFDVWSSLGATSWTFGDGETAMGAATAHTYAHAGTFTVGLTSADALENSSNATRTIAIAPAPTAPPPPPAQPPPSPRSPPAVTGLRLSPSTFDAARSGPSVKAAAVRAATRVSYTLNKGARVRFTIQRRDHGRAVGGRCVEQRSSNRGRTGCGRFVTVGGSFTRSRLAGKDRFTFTGRVGGRALKPGRYRLEAIPTADGRAGTPGHASFRVAP
jgi:hypothetical protein